MNTIEKLKTGNKRILLLFAAVIGILSIPLIAMQLTNEVNWTASDFLIMGILLFGTAIIIELIIRNVKTLKARIILCAVVVFILLIIWAELAVGIFGTPFADN